MLTVIDDLEADHKTCAGLLDTLEAELTRIAAIEEPDYPLMALVLDYLLTYPDQVHHPKEDLIYQLLLRKFPEIRDSLDDLEKQHVELAKLTRSFADTLRDVTAGEAVMRDDLLKAGRSFVETYRDHMRGENVGVFRMARRHLTAGDLESVAAQFADAGNPLSGPTAEAKFARLLDDIHVASGERVS